MSYFSTQGITSTSANYIANKAKEFYTQIEEELNKISFVTTTATLLGSSQAHLLQKGDSIETLQSYIPKITKIQEAKSLIAYLREAIKEKDRLLEEAQKIQLDELVQFSSIVPATIEPITEEQIIDQMSIKDRAHYLSLETYCSTIGKLIHPSRSLSAARKELNKIKSTTSTITEKTNTCVIYTYEPSVKLEEVDKLFYQLQELHRTYQAELNGIKHSIHLQAEESTLKAREQNQVIMQEYNAKHLELLEKQVALREQKCKEIRDLKIQIPNSLKDIYNEINSL
jgi:hypothetical protein